MKLTNYDIKQASKAKACKHRGGRPIDPEGLLAIAREHGINRNTLRSRLRSGKSMDEALAMPIKSRVQCGQMAAKARWGGAK